MTTVATDGLVLAADSAIALGTSNGEVIRGRPYGVPKVWRQNGSMWGYAANTATQEEFKYHINHHFEEPFVSLSLQRGTPIFEGIEIDSDGGVWFWGDGSWKAPVIPPEAIGTGQVIAQAVMACGFDPRWAIHVAAHLDVGTSEPIHFILKDEVEETYDERHISNDTWVLISNYTGRIVEIGKYPYNGKPSYY